MHTSQTSWRGVVGGCLHWIQHYIYKKWGFLCRGFWTFEGKPLTWMAINFMMLNWPAYFKVEGRKSRFEAFNILPTLMRFEIFFSWDAVSELWTTSTIKWVEVTFSCKQEWLLVSVVRLSGHWTLGLTRWTHYHSIWGCYPFSTNIYRIKRGCTWECSKRAIFEWHM